MGSRKAGGSTRLLHSIALCLKGLGLAIQEAAGLGEQGKQFGLWGFGNVKGDKQRTLAYQGEKAQQISRHNPLACIKKDLLWSGCLPCTASSTRASP